MLTLKHLKQAAHITHRKTPDTYDDTPTMPDQTKDQKTQLPELLREISEVAPGVVRTWIDSGTEDRVFKLSFISWRIYCQQDAAEFKRANRAIIQAALQEACRSRGWGYSVSTLPMEDGDVGSHVAVKHEEDGYPTDFNTGCEYGYGDNDALAFARSFLKALRAEQ